MPQQKKWQKFESLVAHVQSTLAPQSKIGRNEKILGKRSKTVREIDITVRQNVGQYNIFVAIDCKDRKRPIDLKEVEEFIGLVKDVGANKGAIVSASGFTQAARTRATDAGIDIYRLVDAEKHDWQCYVSIPVLCDFRRIKSFRFRFRGTGPFRMMPQDARTMVLFNQSREPIDTMLNLLCKKWNSGLLPIEPGEYRDVKLTDVKTFVKTEGNFYQVEVTANIHVEKNLYFGQLPLVEIKGFEDQIGGGLITKGFETADLDVVEVERDWQRVKSEEELAVKPIFSLMATDHYPLMKLET